MSPSLPHENAEATVAIFFEKLSFWCGQRHDEIFRSLCEYVNKVTCPADMYAFV